jgi:hypothetical protein
MEHGADSRRVLAADSRRVLAADSRPALAVDSRLVLAVAFQRHLVVASQPLRANELVRGAVKRPRWSRRQRARASAALMKRPRASRAANCTRMRPARTGGHRLCASTSSMNTGAYSATGSLDVGCAGIVVAESFVTVTPERVALNDALGPAPRSVVCFALGST